jgi:hypothetical protein
MRGIEVKDAIRLAVAKRAQDHRLGLDLGHEPSLGATAADAPLYFVK